MATDGLTIASVEPGSIAEEIGLEPGDVLLSIDGVPVKDVIDVAYRFAAEEVMLEVETHNSTMIYSVSKDDYDPLGASFVEELAGGRIRRCNNRCVFCFVDQLPPGLRRSLSIKDDDYRLSFLHGAYITLTNMSDIDYARIETQRLSPLYVSVHATNPDTRQRLLRTARRHDVRLELLRLMRMGIDVHTQVVVVPGWNDGEHLVETLQDLRHLAEMDEPGRVESVAVVPVGLTAHRSTLQSIGCITPAYAADLITQIRRADRLADGRRFVYLADEWFHIAGTPYPGAAYYRDFPQLDDGVGTARLFLERCRRLQKRLPERVLRPMDLTLVTGEAAAPLVHHLSGLLKSIAGVTVSVCVVPNRLFGHMVNVAGLLCGADICAALKQHSPRGVALLPTICLRDGQLTLDDWTPERISREASVDLHVIDPHPSAVWEYIKSRQEA